MVARLEEKNCLLETGFLGPNELNEASFIVRELRHVQGNNVVAKARQVTVQSLRPWVTVPKAIVLNERWALAAIAVKRALW